MPGVVELPIKASTTCVNASIPVVAVINGGRPTVSWGSSTAYLGRMEGSLMEALWWVAA